jgi:hypothetical protein
MPWPDWLSKQPGRDRRQTPVSRGTVRHRPRAHSRSDVATAPRAR